MMLVRSLERAAQVNGNGPATVFEGRRRTWREVRDRVARLAAALKLSGILPGDRVAILGLNSDRYLEAQFAIWWAGAVIMPINLRWSAAEVSWSLNDAGVTVLMVDDAFAGLAGEMRSGGSDIRHVIHMGEAAAPEGFSSFESLVAEAGPAAPVARDPSALASLYYTGGTTGRPKGVMLSEQAMWTSSMCVAMEVGLDQSSRFLHAAPMFHNADGAIITSLTIVAGCHVITPVFRPDRTIEIIAAERVDTTLLVPTMIRMLVDDPVLPGTDLSSFRRIIYGASPMPETTLRAATRALPNVEFIQAYGQTELAPLATVLHNEHHRGDAAKLTSAGRATYCVEVKVADEHGQQLAPGEVGEIRVRGPNAMTGYWNNPELTAETLVDGWIRTGDAGRMDADGFLYVCDRVKDMIITGGENVFSVEVEGALASHPAVAEAAVIGVPDETYGERVHAVVVLRPGHDADSARLQEHCRSLIAGYKVPRSFEFREGPLPLSAAGKVLKSDLRAPHWAGLDRGVN